MLQHCTKFRLFIVLLFLGLLNIVFFRTYINQTLGTILRVSKVSHTLQGNTMLRDNITLWGNIMSRGSTTSLVEKVKEFNTTRALYGKNATRQAASQVPTLDGPLIAFGKIVKPRANITAPWKKGNNSTPCPLVPPNLVGRMTTYKQAPSWTEIAGLNPGLEPGGHYQPAECKARHRVAIIIPYRNREEHLRVLLHNLHPMLKRQQLDYFILVVELEQPTTFNRGMLLNIGAVEALGLWDVQCVIFHDVDLLPEDDRNLYSCPEMPRHMSVAIDKYHYKLPYSTIFGGVSALSCDSLFKANGYSNVYFGWGGEDDDLQRRIKAVGLKVNRYSMEIARYRMIKHLRDDKNEPNEQRFHLLRNFQKRMPWDGLNSLQYEVKKVDFTPAYTWMLVSIDEKKMLQGLR
ncbi:hypothetical protein ACOMHN_048655 [Nucella lapillus]